VTDADSELRSLFRTLTPSARERLRSVLIRDQADRDTIASSLMRYRDQNGQAWADLIDMLTMYPDARRQVVRVLAEIDASERDLD
jgi:DNA mismatch repair ATPase MutS